jgi:hypothetical protein
MDEDWMARAMVAEAVVAELMPVIEAARAIRGTSEGAFYDAVDAVLAAVDALDDPA